MQVNFNSKAFSFLGLYDQFIKASKSGKRVQPNGKMISPGTIANYGYTAKLLESYSKVNGKELRIRPARYLNTREMRIENNYWKKFYRKFTDYLYKDCGHYDNYVGQTIKNIKVFFNYLDKEMGVGVGSFHKKFYVRKEETPIFPLMPEELNFLIYDRDFEKKLSKRMREVKDFFVFGCTVALRVSDLFNLKKSNLREVNNQQYLAVRSIKTSTDTMVRLPNYATEILCRYKKRKKLLPTFNKSNLNKYIKLLLEQAGFTQPIKKIREKRGKSIEINIASHRKTNFTRFCDVGTTHTMRRTAITTMLCLGMPEQLVRKISGHSPASKEFYRYVLWSQSYQDKEMQQMFEKLQVRVSLQ